MVSPDPDPACQTPTAQDTDDHGYPTEWADQQDVRKSGLAQPATGYRVKRRRFGRDVA